MTTVVALAVIIAAKFVEGAWITLLAIPSLIFLFRTFKNYYDRVGRRSGSHSRSTSPPTSRRWW